MSAPSIGFIGFGEAASAIAAGLKREGVRDLAALDVRPIEASGVAIVATARELAARADVIVSAVVAGAAIAAAESMASDLDADHLYVDLNSTSPAVQQRIAAIVEPSGAAFVEASVMSAVPPLGHRVPMLLGGRGASRFAELMSPYGMNLEVLGDEVGTASAIKMFRSVMIKGLEALVLECRQGARHFGAEDRVFRSLSESFPGLDWGELADYLAERNRLHGERRAREMEEAARTLEELGVEPVMAEAAVKRLRAGDR
jgi:3-hydroxyisobutyrate dehydrogenase-like beta-hydroxyacid dehydrogenase